MSIKVLVFLLFISVNYPAIMCFPSNFLKGGQHYPSFNWIYEHNRRYYNNLNSYLRSKNDLRWAKKKSKEDLRSLSEKELLEMDLSQLIEMIRKEDSEWLDSVLDIGADEIDNKQPVDNESVPQSVNVQEEIKAKLKLGDDSIPGVREEESFQQEKVNFTAEIKTDNRIEEETFPQYNLEPSQTKSLKNLGYTDSEIVCMKASVVAMVQEGDVWRPGSKEAPLPRQWFKAGSNPYDAVTAGESTQRPKRKPLTAKPNRRYEVNNDDDDDDDDGSEMEEEVGDGVGSAVRWRRSAAAPSQDERKEAIAAAVTRDVKSQSRFDSPARSRSSTQDDYTNTNDAGDYGDYGDGDDDGGEFSFWPSKEEFKDLLLDESRMRVEIAGDWMTPFVKEETKWRYRIYKDWLRFLEDGFGDTFDVVEDAFEQGQGGVEPSPVTGRATTTTTTIREKLVSRDDPTYSSDNKKRAGDQRAAAPVPIPVLKSEVKKVRAMLDNAGAPASVAGRKTVATTSTPTTIASATTTAAASTTATTRKGSRAALYDEYIRKISDAQESSQFRRVQKQKMDEIVDDDENDGRGQENSVTGRREVYDWFGDEDIDDEDDSIDMTNLKRKINDSQSSRSNSNSNSIYTEQRRAPKTVSKNEEESVDDLDEIDYINIRNPRSSQ